MKAFKILVCLVFMIPILGKSNPIDTTGNYTTKTKLVLGGASVGYVGSLTGLSVLWYGKMERSPFHFFNDNSGWMQMDKYGHALTNYSITLGLSNFLEWGGMNKKLSVVYGAGISFLYSTTIEVLDGMSPAWGFSMGDIYSNVGGIGLAASQELLWDEQRVALKWSYHKTIYSDISPEIFGSSWTEQWLKDYNGQTYWLVFKNNLFLKDQKKWYNYLDPALGFSATGMLGANDNKGKMPEDIRTRQYIFSMDINISKLLIDLNVLKFNKWNIFFKVPFPAVEYNRLDGVKFHGVYI